MGEEKVIHSLAEISKKAEDLNNNVQSSKNWLMKSLELISAETVLVNIKKGDKIINRLSANSPYIARIKAIQEALGYYYYAYYRSKNKDKRAQKGVEEQKKKFKIELEKYVKENLELKETYERGDVYLLEQSIDALEGMNNHYAPTYRISLRENEKSYNTYQKFINISFNNVNESRVEYKKNFSKTSKLIRDLDAEIREKFKKSVDLAEEWVLSDEKLRAVSKKEIKETLKYISYFNSKAYTKYADIVNKFFLANLINSFMENDMEYNDYDQLRKFGEKYIQLIHGDYSNEAVKKAINRLKDTIIEYNETYTATQFNYLFSDILPEREYIDKVFLIERLINESSEDEIISFLSDVCNTFETVSIGDKLFQLESHIKKCNLLNVSFAEKLKQMLKEKHDGLQNSYEIKGEFKLEIENLETKQTFILFKKKEIVIGRSRLNDIRINSQYIATGKHVLLDTENGNIYNGSKHKDENDENSEIIYSSSFINNDGENPIVEVNIHNDKIYELNLGHAFTFKLPEKNEKMFTLEAFEDKSNPEGANETAFDRFINTKYILLKELEDIYLPNDGTFVSLEPLEDTFTVSFKESKIFLEGIDDMPRIITEGDNLIDNKFRLKFQTYN